MAFSNILFAIFTLFRASFISIRGDKHWCECVEAKFVFNTKALAKI
jgi:hypothetical protein